MVVPDRVSDTELVSHWKNHVHQRLSEEIKLILDPKGDTPMRDLLQLAINRERLNRGKTRKRGSTDEPEGTNRESKRWKKEKQRRKGENTKKQNKEGQEKDSEGKTEFKGTCNKCGKYGHKKVNCPLLNVLGIKANYVDVQDTPPDDYIAAEKGPAVLSVPGKIGNRLYNYIYLDSGAEVNMITKALVDRMTVEQKRAYGYREAKPNTRTSFSGMFDDEKEGVKPVGMFSRLPVRLGGGRYLSKIIHQLFFYVMKSIPFSIMIGFTHWKRMIKAIDLNKNQLILRDGSSPTYVNFNRENEPIGVLQIGKELADEREPSDEDQKEEVPSPGVTEESKSVPTNPPTENTNTSASNGVTSNLPTSPSRSSRSSGRSRRQSAATVAKKRKQHKRKRREF
jgi:hypothetical protein